jgi:rhodanese-related sulfurtransferase
MPKFTEPNALNDTKDESPRTVVDVRSPEEYAAGHVPAAVNIPVDELEARQSEIPKDRPVVTYCNMYHPGSSRGERAADLLQAKGFEASALNGGYPAWFDLSASKNDKPDE